MIRIIDSSHSLEMNIYSHVGIPEAGGMLTQPVKTG